MRHPVLFLRHMCVLGLILFLFFLGLTNHQPEHRAVQAIIGIPLILISIFAFFGLKGPEDE